MFNYRNINNIKIAITDTENQIISCTQDAVDLLGEAGSENCSSIIIYERNLHPDFFKLKTGLAGDILQKFSNYRIKVAIVGEFSKFNSKSLQDFIRESNKGKSVFFVENLDVAFYRITGKPFES